MIESFSNDALNPNLTEKIQREIEVITAVLDIYEKIKCEDQIQPIITPLKLVISNEISFALEKIKESSLPEDTNELKKQVMMNSYIFKENLKIICNVMGELISGVCVEGSDPTGKSGVQGAVHREENQTIKVFGNQGGV